MKLTTKNYINYTRSNGARPGPVYAALYNPNQPMALLVWMIKKHKHLFFII